MKELKFYDKVYIMSRYYFTYLQFFIFCCLLSLGYMFNNRWIILIGYAQIFLLPNPESYDEIYKRFGHE